MSILSYRDAATAPYPWVPVSTSSLLRGEPTGAALDFTNTTSAKRVRTANSGALVDREPLGFLVVGNYIFPPRLRDASNNRVWIAHNLYRNSDAPATQTRTVVVGQNYTVSVVGSGSITLSGAGTGTVTAGSPVTFTASTTSLVSTVSGTLTRMQLNRGAVATAYVAAGASADAFGPPISWDAANNEWSLLIEPQRTNSLLNSTAPVTQTVSLAAGTYTLWVEGTGSCALSGGPTGTATEGSPVTFTLGGTTSVTFTITGSLTFFQCENGPVPTSQIITYGGAVTRAGGNISLPTSAFGGGSEFSAYADYYAPTVSGTQNILTVSDGANDNFGLRHTTSNQANMFVNDNGVIQANAVNSTALTVGNRVQWAGTFKANLFAHSLNGNPIPLTGGQDVAGTMPTGITSVFLGSFNGISQPAGPLRIRRIAIVPRARSIAEITGWNFTYTTDPTAYDVFLVAGQSNTLNGFQFEAGVDVANANVDTATQTGAVQNATEPLPHVATVSARVGFALAFARDFYVPNRLVGGRKVLLVPAGLGDTGFTDGRWGVGRDLYNNAVTLTAFILKRYPNAVLRGILWHQGEKDAAVGTSQSAHAVQLDATLNGFRSELGNVPIVVGGMVPEWVAADANRAPVQAALIDTPNRLTNTGYANPSSPTVIPGRPTDIIHFDAAGQRGTSGAPGGMAGRYWTAYSGLTT